MCNFAMQEITRYDTRFAQNICNLNIFKLTNAIFVNEFDPF